MSITGIITSYLSLRLVVRRGFINIYPGQTAPAHLQSVVSGYATTQASGLRLSRFRTMGLLTLITSGLLVTQEQSSEMHASHRTFKQLFYLILLDGLRERRQWVDSRFGRD
jgi:hypothetical protein